MNRNFERRSKVNGPLRAVIDVGQRMSEKLREGQVDNTLATLWTHALSQFHASESRNLSIYDKSN